MNQNNENNTPLWHYTDDDIPTHQFCDHVVSAPSSSALSAHEVMNFANQLRGAPAKATQLTQARSAKPWLAGRKPIIYVEAQSEIRDPDLCRGIMEATQSADGPRCVWLIDDTLLDPSQPDLPNNVIPVMKIDPENCSFDAWYREYDVRFEGPVVLRLYYGLLQILEFPNPEDWLVVQATSLYPDDTVWVNSQGEFPTEPLTESELAEEIRRAKDHIKRFRPASCPVFLNDDPTFCHDVPDWI